jgi:hypothetical protein
VTVAEIKAKLPECEVYEMRPDAQYLILVDSTRVPLEAVQALAESPMELKACFMFIRGGTLSEAMRIIELPEDIHPAQLTGVGLPN